MTTIQNKGLIVAGTQSSSGKTLINAMLLCALKKRGWEIQPYKTGPDYIDTAYSSQYAGKSAYNLDFWMMSPEEIQLLVARQDAKTIGVVEGVMGLFDGVNPDSNEGSTWSLSKLTNWPVILVVPAAKQGRSIRATIKGFLAEAGEGCIEGVILNNVSGDSHADYIKRALKDLPVPVLGAVPRLEDVEWPERHLGLRASQEFEPIKTESLVSYAESYLNLDQIIQLVEENIQIGQRRKVKSSARFGEGKRLAIAKDEAFHFYYQANLDVLEDWGFELVPFSPLYQQLLPNDIDGIILGGGFPEEYVEQLEYNAHMRYLIKKSIDAGKPCYAECGGLMYLCDKIRKKDGSMHVMSGVIPGQVEMTDRLQHFGYSECVIDDHLKGYRGHEFHYSKWNLESEHANLWTVTKSSAKKSRTEGFRYKKLHASYIHLYFPEAESLFRNLFGGNIDESQSMETTMNVLG